jgi:hypothetical protein
MSELYRNAVEKLAKFIKCLHCGKDGTLTFRLVQIVKGDYRFNTWKKINPAGWNKGRNGYLCPECLAKRIEGK